MHRGIGDRAILEVWDDIGWLVLTIPLVALSVHWLIDDALFPIDYYQAIGDGIFNAGFAVLAGLLAASAARAYPRHNMWVLFGVILIAFLLAQGASDAQSCLEGFTVQTRDGTEGECFVYSQVTQPEQERASRRGMAIFFTIVIPGVVGARYGLHSAPRKQSEGSD